MDLIDFLNDRLADDEQEALAWRPHGDEPGEMDYRWQKVPTYTPARVAAEVESKRRRLARHTPTDDPHHGRLCSWCSVPQVGVHQAWPCPDIRDDAAAYATHPSYRSEWAP